jgi:hypothetical protein
VVGAGVGAAGAGAGAGAGGVGVGVGAGGVGVGVGAGGVGVRVGVVGVGGCGALPVFAGVAETGSADAGAVVLTGGVAFADVAWAAGFRAAKRAWGKARGATGMTTTVRGASLSGLPGASGSTNGTGCGVSASDHSRADPTTQAAATNTAANRRVPTATSSRTFRTAWTRSKNLEKHLRQE